MVLVMLAGTTRWLGVRGARGRGRAGGRLVHAEEPSARSHGVDVAGQGAEIDGADAIPHHRDRDDTAPGSEGWVPALVARVRVQAVHLLARTDVDGGLGHYGAGLAGAVREPDRIVLPRTKARAV